MDDFFDNSFKNGFFLGWVEQVAKAILNGGGQKFQSGINQNKAEWENLNEPE